MHILIAEDDITSRLVLESTLRKRGYTVTSVNDGETAWAVLRRENPPRLALLDWIMPGLSGLEVCERVRGRPDAEDRYVYIILLTGKSGIEEIIAGLEAGADDYVTKPFNTDELELRIRAGKRVMELQDQLVEAKRQLRIQAEHDSLTGVLNRSALFARLDAELSRTDRESGVVGVAMIDLDHFKRVNDTFGHHAGDAVLRQTVERVQGCLRKYDIFGRYGGEEFVLAVPSPQRDAEPFERVRRVIGESEMGEGGLSIPVTVSIGVAWGNAASDLEHLLRQADEALYRAKDKGRNRVEIAPADGPHSV